MSRHEIMIFANKVVVVTGGASGIGRALCQRAAADGARAVIVADRDAAGAAKVAAEIGGHAVTVDVGVEADLQALVAGVVARVGAIDMFFSNAGLATGGDIDVPDAEWDLAWRVHVMASVWAARAVVPGMIAGDGGWFVVTASAAGLLSNIGAAPYAVTKHGAVAFAEWLSITYGDRGLRVACLCPMGVRTTMFEAGAGNPAIDSVRVAGTTLEPEAVAEAVVQALTAGKFLILPHPEVADFERRRATDRDGWLAGMRRFQARLLAKS